MSEATQKLDPWTHLDPQYIKEHISGVHTPESWARAITQLALKAAADKMGTTSAASVDIDAKITISAYQPQTCINICATIEGVMVCYHANV